MARAFLVVMDSVGIGGAPDADSFFNGRHPDKGANTVLHIAQACAAGRAQEGRNGPLNVPNLTKYGLGAAIFASTGDIAPNLSKNVPDATWAAATEFSRGKDTPTGHWELAGLTLQWDWSYFPDTRPAFDQELVQEICKHTKTEGILGNCHASGTQIIEDLAQEHINTGWPICYTSTDSVLQIAAHEDHFGLERLVKLCQDLAPFLHARRVGRVIARPFVGSEATGWKRTSNRRDFAMTPPADVITDYMCRAGKHVVAIGKIGDIFSMRGIHICHKGTDAELMTALEKEVETAASDSFVFANFVEFDSVYGHRRDVSGYARALEWFDREIGKIAENLRPDDLMIITADHGNDPTWVGTEHTRERVPVLIIGAKPKAGGVVNFVDVAATLGQHMGLMHYGMGKSII